MDDGDHIIRPTEDGELVIPDGTQFVVIDLDQEKERVMVEFMLNGKMVRAWAPASYFQKMTKN